jgi:hypothetical protein
MPEPGTGRRLRNTGLEVSERKYNEMFISHHQNPPFGNVWERQNFQDEEIKGKLDSGNEIKLH